MESKPTKNIRDKSESKVNTLDFQGGGNGQVSSERRREFLLEIPRPLLTTLLVLRHGRAAQNEQEEAPFDGSNG